MSQMCPSCSHNNPDTAHTCSVCGTAMRGLLGENTVLSNRYKVSSVLGCGAMGAVYLANDQRLVGRRCAVKENRLDPSASPDVQSQSREQFLAEASVLARLDHPSLPKVSDYFIEDGREYLVMDYVEGEDLDSRIQRTSAPLEEALVLDWADQVLDALSYLHSQHPLPIIHRDIKPANLRLDTRNRVKLVDFGLVKLLDSNNPETKVELRGLGTPAYAPLEQFAGSDSHTDARSDIYALGATLYHLLTHIAPPNVHERLLKPEVLTSPRELNNKLTEKAERIIMKAIGIHPTERYQSADEMRKDIAEKTPVAAAPPVKAAKSAPAKKGVSPMMFGALALLFIAILAAAAFFVFGERAGNLPPQQANAAVEPSATPTELILSALSDAPTGTPTSTSEATEEPTVEPTTEPEESPTTTPTPSRTPSPTADASTPTSSSSLTIPASTLDGTIAYPIFNGVDYDLYFGQADGSGTTLFRKGASQPAFSPDGTRVAFHSWRLDSWGLMTMNLTESNAYLVARFVEDQLPTWSADGSEIIFLSRREGDRKSRLMKVGSTQVGSDGIVIGEGEYPSINGTGRMAFKGWGSTGNGIRTATSNLSDVQVVTTDNSDTAPMLSPDGERIIFMSRREGHWDIYSANPDGSDVQRLTESPSEDGLPTWSPDGRAIAFISNRGGDWAVWAMTPGGSDQQKLFDLEGSPDGFVGSSRDASRGWAEERISWTN
ncbi:MAG: PD40 domain-containing protein [Anaerolineae bacterium]|nr:PD40 domain-containing protein [Anaerolineae bacterium]